MSCIGHGVWSYQQNPKTELLAFLALRPEKLAFSKSDIPVPVHIFLIPKTMCFLTLNCHSIKLIKYTAQCSQKWDESLAGQEPRWNAAPLIPHHAPVGTNFRHLPFSITLATTHLCPVSEALFISGISYEWDHTVCSPEGSYSLSVIWADEMFLCFLPLQECSSFKTNPPPPPGLWLKTWFLFKYSEGLGKTLDHEICNAISGWIHYRSVFDGILGRWWRMLG